MISKQRSVDAYMVAREFTDGLKLKTSVMLEQQTRGGRIGKSNWLLCANRDSQMDRRYAA